MGRINYYEWLKGGCGCGCNEGCRDINPCDCDSILLSISKLETNDSILQDEIDYVSGVVDTISGGCDCDLTDYYTKEEVDALIPEVPSLSGYATEQWVLDKHYITGVDLSDYVTYDDIPDLTSFATKEWVLNQNFVTNTELIQYITNLQEQINSLTSAVSGCCGSSGETTYRWITLTGENDYWCSGATKYSKEKEQSSTDGINWVDTGNIRNGSTILEENCVECGYVPPTPSGDSNANIDLYFDTQNRLSGKTTYKTSNICYGDVITTKLCVYHGDGSTSTTCEEYNQCFTSFTSNDIDSIALNSYGFGTEITKSTGEIKTNEYNGTDAHGVLIHSGVTSIGDYAFANNKYLEEVGRPQLYPVVNPKYLLNLTSIGNYTFANNPELTTVYLNGLNAGVPTLGIGAFSNCPKLAHIYVDSSLVEQFKTALGWSTFASIIQAA